MTLTSKIFLAGLFVYYAVVIVAAAVDGVRRFRGQPTVSPRRRALYFMLAMLGNLVYWTIWNAVEPLGANRESIVCLWAILLPVGALTQYRSDVRPIKVWPRRIPRPVLIALLVFQFSIWGR